MHKKPLIILIFLLSVIFLNAQNPYPVVKVDTIQFVHQAKLDSSSANTLPDYINPVFNNTTYRDTVSFEGVVVSSPRIYGLSITRRGAYIQRKGGGPWSGVLVLCEPAGTGTTLPALITETKFYDNFIVGRTVKVTGVIRDFQGETQINLIRNNPNISGDNSVKTVSSIPDSLVYTPTTIDRLMQGNPNTTWVQQKMTGEQYEGTLVTIPNVTVTSIQQSGSRTFWSVADSLGNMIEVRDLSAYYRRDDNEDTLPKIVNTFQPPALGVRLAYIRGVVTEYIVSGVSRYGIYPIYPSDMGPCNICPPEVFSSVKTPAIVTHTDSVAVMAMVVSKQPLASVGLRYNTTGDNTFTEVLMSNISGNNWIAKIPPFAAGTVVRYYVRATNSFNLKTDFPDTLATNSSYLVTDSGITSIAILQYSNTSNGASIWDGDTLTGIHVEGIVTGNNFHSDSLHLLTLQDGMGPNSAIFIQRSATNDIAEKWEIGDRVSITRAVVKEQSNITTLNEIGGVVLSKNNRLPAFADNLLVDPFITNNIANARKWEGVLVRWDSVYVTNVNPDAPTNYGEWRFHKDSTKTGLRVDDLSVNFKGLNTMLKKGMFMRFIQGPMYFSNGNFKLIPRDFKDIDLRALDSIAPEIILLGHNPDTIKVGSGVYVDPGATAIDNIDGDITDSIVVTGTVNTTSVGIYVLNYKVSDNRGNIDSTTRVVIVVDTTHVGINENEMNFAQLSVYPNPANEQITISAKYIKTTPVTVTVVDMLGRTIETRTYTNPEFTDVINTSNFSNGVYFCTISNASGSKTLKFMVSGK